MSPETAEVFFAEAVKAHQSGQIKEASRLYEKILEVHPNHHHALHLLGTIEASSGNAFLARRLMESSLRIAPDEPDVLANLAQVLLHLGEEGATLALTERSLKLDPRNARCHFTRGKALAIQNSHKEAIVHFDRCIELAPSLTEAYVQRALSAHQLGRLEEALMGYGLALELVPDQAHVLSNKGHALFVLGRWEEARQLLERATALDPSSSDAHFHLGLVHQQANRIAQAHACFEEAVRLHPSHVQGLIHLAYTHQRQFMLPQRSIALLDRALMLSDSRLAPALAARAGLLLTLRQTEEALADYDEAIELVPDNAKIHIDRGEALLMLDRVLEAEASFKKAQSLGGNADYLQYVLASLGACESPQAAPTRYVTDLFDSYAKRFDEHLQSGLKYQSPSLLTQRLWSYTNARELCVLDLGCGTGLCGPLLRERSKKLVGVDLSPKMLELAEARACYDQLTHAEISDYLKATQDVFDCIVAADVFIYVGELRKIFERVARSLADGGLLAFTAERSDTKDLVLRPSRRFAHSANYLRSLANETGFAVLEISPSVLRQESGKDVDGYIVVVRKNKETFPHVGLA